MNPRFLIPSDQTPTRNDRVIDRAKKVMSFARQEAQKFNHEYIGTEHILLGLVQEGSGVAANVLKNMSIDLEKVRHEVEKIVKTGPNDGHDGPAAVHAARQEGARAVDGGGQSASATTTSAPSTCCSGSSRRTKASPPRS